MPVVRFSITVRFVAANLVKPVIRSAVANLCHKKNQYVKNLGTRVDHQTLVDRMLCVVVMATSHHANAFKDILVLHHTVVPNASSTPIAHLDWHALTTSVWIHVQAHAEPTQNAALLDTPCLVCAHKDTLEIRSFSAFPRRLSKSIHAIRHLAVPMLNASKGMELDLAVASMTIKVIHTKVAVPNVFSVLIALPTKPVLGTNAKIHVLEFVVEMHSACHLTMFQHAYAWTVIMEIRLFSVKKRYKNP